MKSGKNFLHHYLFTLFLFFNSEVLARDSMIRFVMMCMTMMFSFLFIIFEKGNNMLNSYIQYTIQQKYSSIGTAESDVHDCIVSRLRIG